MAVARHTRERIAIMPWIWGGVCLVLMGRVLYLQWIGHTGQEVIKHAVTTQVIHARHGTIYSRNGGVLAVSVSRPLITANPRDVLDKPLVAQKLAAMLDLDEGEILDKLNKTLNADGSKNYYVEISRDASPQVADEIRRLARDPVHSAGGVKGPPLFRGIDVRTWHDRQYPMGDTAAQLIGYVNKCGQGTGLEIGLRHEIDGVDGWRKAEVDGTGAPIPFQFFREKPARQGDDVILTLDGQIQRAAERALDELMEKWKPDNAVAIAMRPSTGEVLAMVSRPAFDLNHLPDSLRDGIGANRVIQQMYEPGSTLKPIVASACVQAGVAPPNLTFYCGGEIKIGGRIKRCWILAEKGCGHGEQTLSDAITNSCNIAMMGFGQRLGKERLYEYLRKFGFGTKTGIECPSEAAGIIAPLRSWGLQKLLDASFGQGIAVTPLQLLTAICTIANGGVLMRPYVVKEVRREDGSVVSTSEPHPVRRVISEATALRVTRMMERVMTEGTGARVKVEGYEVAGKTGTAQKALENGRGYYSDRVVSSFVGFLPAENPTIAILVVADSPHGARHGSVVCGPVFAEIAREAMLWLQIRPLGSPRALPVSAPQRERPARAG